MIYVILQGAPNSAKFRGGGGCRGSQDLTKGGCKNYLTLKLSFFKSCLRMGMS